MTRRTHGLPRTGVRRVLALTNIHAKSWRKGAKTAELKLTVRHARRREFLR
jgi:hypothetical protein